MSQKGSDSTIMTATAVTIVPSTVLGQSHRGDVGLVASP